MRFWQYEDFAGANSGCSAGLTLEGGGRWTLASDWAPFGDGCNDEAGGATRTVIETSYADSTREGRNDHRSFYLVASVGRSAAGYDLDRVVGGTGCNEHDLVVAEVPGFLEPSRTTACRDRGSGPLALNRNPYDCQYTNFQLELGALAAPDLWATEDVLSASGRDIAEGGIPPTEWDRAVSAFASDLPGARAGRRGPRTAVRPPSSPSPRRSAGRSA